MSSRRQLVQYGDLEQNNGASSSAAAIQTSPQQPPSKKRKRSNQKTQRSRKTAHWDDTGDLTSQMNYDDDDDSHAQAEDGEIGEEESRELTHEEIWDDSALIDAWNSATAEYEVRPRKCLCASAAL